MNTLVVDASVAAAWLFDDEDDARANAALVRIESDTAFVPQVWHLEVRSALLAAERRRRIREDEVEERLRFLLQLPVKTDAEPDLGAAFALARRRRLSFYDAVYLELALRRGGALATLDSPLARAAVAEGLALVEPTNPSAP